MKSSRIVDCHETSELRVDALSASISASLFHIAIDHCPGFDIYANAAEPDEITQLMVNQAFTLSSNFFLLKELIPPGGRVLDLGAHIGTFSLYAASSGYHLLSVEASPYNAALFKQSVSRNQFGSIKVVEKAVSDSAGTAEFIVAGPYSLLAPPSFDSPRITVPMTTVGDILRAEGWDRVDFIKMDIEGSEVAAIRGMAELLSGDHAPFILYESNGHTLRLFGETPEHLMATLEGFGYHCYLVDGNALIPCHSGELQMDVNVDYLATKHPIGTLSDWHVREPLSVQEKIDRSL